jgi:hypothetical protein
MAIHKVAWRHNNIEEKQMLNIQPKAAAFVANIAAVAALSLGFVAIGTLSASAESKPTVQSAAQSQPSMPRWNRKTFDRLYLMTPSYASPADTTSPCKTAPAFCPDYHGDNGG